MNKQNERSGMRLLSSGKRGFFRIVFSRVGLIALLLILQVALIFAVMLWFYKILPHLLVVQGLFVAVMVLILINSRAASERPAARHHRRDKAPAAAGAVRAGDAERGAP